LWTHRPIFVYSTALALWLQVGLALR